MECNFGATTNHSIYSFQPTVTRIIGHHTVRVGYDLRVYQEFGASPGAQAGRYSDTKQQRVHAPAGELNVFGQDLASVLLGLPTGGSIDRNAVRLNTTPYHGVFVRDDWKVSNTLTLNVGLRNEYEGPTRDSENRNARHSGRDEDGVLGADDEPMRPSDLVGHDARHREG